MTSIDTTSAFAGATNDRNPSAKFPEVGTKYVGTVTRVSEHTGTNDFNGKEETSVVVDLQVSADETFTLWCRTHIEGQVAPNGITRAVADAVREGTGASGLPVEGAKLAVLYERDGQSSKPGQNPPKIYKAKYEPPASTPATQQGGPFDQPTSTQAPQPETQAPAAKADDDIELF